METVVINVARAVTLPESALILRAEEEEGEEDLVEDEVEVVVGEEDVEGEEASEVDLTVDLEDLVVEGGEVDEEVAGVATGMKEFSCPPMALLDDCLSTRQRKTDLNLGVCLLQVGQLLS